MADTQRRPLYKNIIGDTKATIAAIQKFLEKNREEITASESFDEYPCESVNRILNSVASEDINKDIEKIIDNL